MYSVQLERRVPGLLINRPRPRRRPRPRLWARIRSCEYRNTSRASIEGSPGVLGETAFEDEDEDDFVLGACRTPIGRLVRPNPYIFR